MKKRALVMLLLLIFVLPLLPAAAGAEEIAPTQIHTPEDLLAMSENPTGSYILMADLDMTGIDWKPLDFGGTFDGNGHAILNLTISQTGDATVKTYDGNRKEYETTVSGMFGTLQDAAITNLQLLNVWALMDVDTPGFLGGLAGYAENTTISDCTVSGCLELRAYDRMFGIGGVVGYGSGSVERCSVDVTLICVDTDTAKDEQFLGGVYAAGFMDVKDCDIVIEGYVSEHGYTHNGGIVGMYAEYPLGVGQSGYITGNSVTGKITFFEDNSSRRAYCKPYVGEAMVNRYYLDRNTDNFQRDERTDYSVELRPEMCSEPSYSLTLVTPGCSSYGYTEYQCKTCGYSYTDHYTLFAHTVTNWTVTEEPTLDKEGQSTGTCDICGAQNKRVEPKLEPEPSQTTAAPEAPEADTQTTEATQEPNLLFPVLIALDIALLIAAALIIRRISRNKRRRRRRRKSRY